MATKKLDVMSLALELQSLESETFEIHDYAEAGDMLAAISPVGPGAPTAPVSVDGSTSTSSTSTCSSTTSTTSCCA
jgi:thiazolylpeptide-type bacteriocin precursor